MQKGLSQLSSILRWHASLVVALQRHITSAKPNKTTLHSFSLSIKPPRSETQRPAQSRPLPLRHIESQSANTASNPRVPRFEQLDPASYVLLMRCDVRGGRPAMYPLSGDGETWFLNLGPRSVVLGARFRQGCRQGFDS